jgi:hypothetical protein
LKQLQKALRIVLIVASGGLITHAAYKNRNNFQEIRNFVQKLNIKQVINLLGQSLTGIVFKSASVFDALWKRLSGIGNQSYEEDQNMKSAQKNLIAMRKLNRESTAYASANH